MTKVILAMSFSLNYIKDKSFYKLRLLSISAFNILRQNEGAFIIGGLLGKHYSNKFIQISILGSLGLTISKELTTNVIGSICNGWFSLSIYETKNSTSIPIPLKIAFSFKPFKFRGFGVSLFAAINSKKPSFGILFKDGFVKFR
jgi:hypothetical protein